MEESKALSELSHSERVDLAFKRIINYINRREVSTLKMSRKLKEKGFDKASIDEAIDKACKFKYIDDIRYCNCLIRTTLSSGRGLETVKLEIRSLGIDVEDLDSYIEYLELGEDSQIDSALRILEKFKTRSKNIKGSAFNKLIRKGFSRTIASRAIDLYYG